MIDSDGQARVRALGLAMGAMLDFQPTTGITTVRHRELTGADVTSTVAFLRHPHLVRWRIDNTTETQINDGTDEWTLHRRGHDAPSSRPTGAGLLVPVPLYPVFPDRAPILGRSTDDWLPIDARLEDDEVTVTVEKRDNSGLLGALTVDLATKLVRHLDLGWITIEITDFSPTLPDLDLFDPPG